MANGSFKISFDTRALVIFILCVGVLFNIITFFHFYFSSSKKVDAALESLTLSSVKLYDDVIARVDDYLHSVTTNLSFSSSAAVASEASSSFSRNKEDSPILPVVDTLDYDFYVKDGRHIARIGRQDFSSGSPFPRGGVISRVYDDCIILEGGYRVARQNRLASSSSSRPSVSAPSVTSSKVDFPDITSQLKKGLTL
ncbi:MAG: hypothetical protein II823_05925 [Kiritimatiellae bacterium]|nr:hypothetical protein [Kiritimatiellia bacterium]